MEPESVTCPFCGQNFEILIEAAAVSQRFVTDCEVCCRPLEIHVECEDGQIVSLEVQPS